MPRRSECESLHFNSSDAWVIGISKATRYLITSNRMIRTEDRKALR